MTEPDLDPLLLCTGRARVGPPCGPYSRYFGSTQSVSGFLGRGQDWGGGAGAEREGADRSGDRSAGQVSRTGQRDRSVGQISGTGQRDSVVNVHGGVALAMCVVG